MFKPNIHIVLIPKTYSLYFTEMYSTVYLSIREFALIVISVSLKCMHSQVSKTTGYTVHFA